jgi:KAP family P-loop domain
LLFLGLGIWLGFFHINSLINPGKSNGEFPSNNIITASLTFIIASLTGLRAISTSLVPGSARAAEQFVELKGDPMQQISRHFERLVHMMKQPIAIFVDDLDRCHESYTVEFLERIQTLFREAGVFYVIAADRRWLFSSYKKAYDSFKNDIDEPGRPLSRLFLEKTFQLSVTLPRLSPELQRQYWEYLLQTDQYEEIEKKLDAKKEEVQRDMKDRKDNAIIATTEEETGDFLLKQARKEVAVIELAKRERKQFTEQFLKPYAKFLEPNPRAMKRLVNPYSLARDIRILEGLKVEREKLALWTIITMRCRF